MIQSTHKPESNARKITRVAEQTIKNKTGMRVTLILLPTDHPDKTPEQMLNIIAGSLNMSPACYRKKSRSREISDLRFIGAFLLRTYFPSMTLHQISFLFGGQNHTSIMNALTRAGQMIATGNQEFTNKYLTALKAINKWLRKDMSAYASAISA